MITNLIFSGLAIASIAILWRTHARRQNNLNNFLKTKLGLFGTALFCGSCFTYWVTFLFLFIFDPLKNWFLPLRFALPLTLVELLHFLLSWMVLGFIAATFRFGLALINEVVNFLSHRLNNHPKH